MANTIILKRSATPGKVPTTGQLALGEIAINTHDGLIYIKKDDGTPSVVQIGGITSVNGETGAVTLDTGDIAENGNQYFTTARARSAISAGSGISYNSTTGAISTTQTLTTAGTPTFAGLTLTGSISSIAGDIIPSADILYDLGSPTRQWRDIYVGPGSLYVNGTKVLEDNSGTITFTADADQNIRINAVGAGILQLGSSTTNVNVDGTLQIASGKNITDSAGIEVNFGDNIDMNNNKVVGLGAPSASTDAATKGYVDSTVGALSTSSISQGNSNVSVVDTGTGQVLVTVDGTTALTVTATGVVIAGNMTVEGTTTTVNSNTVTIADNIITLNSDTIGTPTQNSGIEVERGDDTNVQLRWDEGSDKWTFTNNGAVYHPISVNTDDLAEGSTNLYHTTGRARAAISASSATGVSYNSTTGAISLGSIPNSSLANNSITINGTSVALGGTRTLDTDVVSEGSVNQYFTNNRARGAISVSGSLAYNSTTGVISFTTPTTIASLSNHTTTNLAEGTNLYYTDARARSAVSFTAGSGAYNSTTGVFTIPTNTNQLTNGANFATTSYVDSAVAGKDNTDEITEGTTNLYFTNARARSAVSAGTGISYNSTTGVITNTITQYTDALARGAVSVTDAGGDGSLSYNSTTGVITYTGPSAAEVRAHFSAGTGITVSSGVIATTITQYTDALARGAVSFTAGSGAYNSTTGVFTIPTNTNQLTNGASFITTAGARSAVSAGTGISYNSTTGVITNTITQYTDALARGAVSAGTGISYNSTTGVITNTITQYTDALARGAVSFTAGSGAYDSTTGVFTIPTNTSQLTNGAGYITSSASISGSAATLTTGRTIALTGDVSYTSGSFNGSANVTGTATLASVGTAGTYTKVTTDAKGRVTSGTTLAAADIPSLDASKITTGIIDAARLPSYVDDVLEFTNLAGFPATGETGKLYVALDTNKVYRWSGSTYIFITSGAVDSVAGKTGVVTLVKGDVGLGNVDNTADSAKNVATAAALTTARTIGGVSFNGTANINLPGVNTAGNQNTTGNATTATTATNATNVTVTSSTTSSAFKVPFANTTASTTGNYGLLQDSTETFTYNPSTNTLVAGTFSGALAGNATTATTLQTARTIQGVSFNGGANITVVTAGTGISVSGTTVTNTLSTGGGSIGGAIAVTGAITATGEVTAFFSDKRLKTNIVPIAEALDKVESISGYTFDPNETALALGIEDRHQMGVIAQEIEAVAPELVCDSAFAGYKTVRYDKLTALLIEAVKELSAKVKTLEAKLGDTKPQL